MKLNKFTSYLAFLGLGGGGALAPLQGADVEAFYPATPANVQPVPFVYDAGNNTWNVKEDFSSFHGTTGTLPAGIIANGVYVTPTFGALQWRDFDNGKSNAAGFFSFANTDPIDLVNPDETDPDDWSSARSFGIHEESGIKDTRFFLKFKNTTGSSLERVIVNYQVQQWRKGARDNSISLKYNNVHTGFSSVDELAFTAAPQGGSVAPLNLDGTDPANYEDVRQLVIFPSPIANYTGSDTIGAGVGYFRWQYSSPGSGSRKSFGITNIDIARVESGTNNAWTGNANDSWTASNKWTSPATWGGTTYNAHFNNAAKSPVDLLAAVDAVDLYFQDSLTITSTGGTPKITLSGVINVASGKVGTISVPVDTTEYGILKIGTGEAILNGNNPNVNGIAVNAGTLTVGANAVINPANRLTLATGTFNVNNQDVTVDGVTAPATGTVTLGNGTNNTLTLDLQNSSSASLRGQITGTDTGDTVLKKGPGVQRFRAAPLTYYAKTQVDEGSLQITQTSGLTNTSAVTLNGVTGEDEDPDIHGDLLFANDGSGGAKTFKLGQGTTGVNIALNGGSISADGVSAITLQNNLVLGADDTSSPVRPAHNNISAKGSTAFTLTGVLSGAEFRKVGEGTLTLGGSSANTHAATEIRNGTLVAGKANALGGGELYFQDKANISRVLRVTENVTVSYLDGNSPDPEDPNDDLLPQQATAFIDIPSSRSFTVDYDAEEESSEEVKPSFQGNIRGVSSTYGTFIKDGTGTQRFTIWPKTFAGAYQVKDGVLQVSYNGRITGATGGILVDHQTSVTTGGQLRLSTGVSNPANIANATYNFGGTLTLQSTGRTIASPVTTGDGWGVLGGLRFDPSTGVQYGALASAVTIPSTKSGDIHVNGIQKEFRLTGTFSGDGTLLRSGGGRLVIGGTSTGFGGPITLNNGATVINSGVTVGDNSDTARAVAVGATSGDDRAELGGAGTIYGAVTVRARGLLSQGEGAAGDPPVANGVWAPVGDLKVNGNLTVEDDAVWVEDLDNADRVTVSGTFTLPHTSNVADFVIDLNGSGEVTESYVIGWANATNFTSTPISLTAANIRNAPEDVTTATISYDSGTKLITITLDF